MTAPSVAYNAQVKTDITQIDMTPFTTILAQEFQTWLAANEKKTVLKLPSKLTDCWSKDRKKCEIFITEGRRKLLP